MPAWIERAHQPRVDHPFSPVAGTLHDAMLTDSHCHLDFSDFDADRAEVLKRARASGVSRILIPGVDLASSRRAVALATEDPMLYAAVGIHPSAVANVHPSDWTALATLARQPKVVAIGEIGLDYARPSAPVRVQQEALQKQLDLAAQAGLPVILHMREARSSQQAACSRDLLAILREWTSALRSGAASGPRACGKRLARHPGVLHAFSGSLEMAQEAIRLGFFLGIGGVITFRNAQARREITAALSPENLLLETDAPFLAPHPHRGQRNEPAFLPLIVNTLGLLYRRETAEIAAITSENARQLFAWE